NGKNIESMQKEIAKEKEEDGSAKGVSKEGMELTETQRQTPLCCILPPLRFSSAPRAASEFGFKCSDSIGGAAEVAPRLPRPFPLRVAAPLDKILAPSAAAATSHDFLNLVHFFAILFADLRRRARVRWRA